jgi:hypothetical protein
MLLRYVIFRKMPGIMVYQPRQRFMLVNPFGTPSKSALFLKIIADWRAYIVMQERQMDLFEEKELQAEMPFLYTGHLW